MSTPARATPERRADRLLRAYPRAWRDRYGAEFHELLVADLSERPRCWRRSADVLRGGVVARLSRTGICGLSLEPADRVRASFAWARSGTTELARA